LLTNYVISLSGSLLPIHCSVDIDSLDPWFAPSTGTPVLGGLTLPELMYIGNSIHETGKLKALDLVEVNPLLFENPSDVKKTVFSAVRVILSFFGFNTIGTIDSDCVVQKPYGRIANKPNEDEKI
jgi:arginase family enzyme